MKTKQMDAELPSTVDEESLGFDAHTLEGVDLRRLSVGFSATQFAHTMALDTSRLLRAFAEFPVPNGFYFSYGTAGFRSDANHLDSTAFRTGVLAALRSLFTRSTIGIMITASHNPVNDNGVKVADPGGDMLSQEWEPFAEALANAVSPDSALQVISDFIRSRTHLDRSSGCGRVILARDTRPSGERLMNAARQGIEAVTGVTAIVVGIITTPQLHWLVRVSNLNGGACEEDYYAQMSKGFRFLLDSKPVGIIEPSENGFIIDGANGVGAIKLLQLKKCIPELRLEIRNMCSEGSELLNDLVGADFVQKERRFPRNFGDLNDLGHRCASFDGDADRIVFFYAKELKDSSLQLRLLDGDKILALFAIFMKQQIEGLTGCLKGYAMKFGAVQTAYANGASTRFLKESLEIEVALTATGVKHLHHKAAEYDVGIYFEANGHGTMIFKEKFLEWLRKCSLELKDESAMEASKKAIQRLLAISEVINQAVGDAFSVLLLVEVILQYLGWSMQQWDSIYDDLPSKQTKVKVQDRASIKTTNAETIVTHPIGLQDAINMEVEKVKFGRAFVRPSGTEDIVRVYAEAETQEQANKLADAVAKHVYTFANVINVST